MLENHPPDRSSGPAPEAVHDHRPARGSWSSDRRGNAQWRDRPVRPRYRAIPCHSTEPPVCAVTVSSDLAAVPTCWCTRAIVKSTDTFQPTSSLASASAQRHQHRACSVVRRARGRQGQRAADDLPHNSRHPLRAEEGLPGDHGRTPSRAGVVPQPAVIRSSSAAPGHGDHPRGCREPIVPCAALLPVAPPPGPRRISAAPTARAAPSAGPAR